MVSTRTLYSLLTVGALGLLISTSDLAAAKGGDKASKSKSSASSLRATGADHGKGAARATSSERASSLRLASFQEETAPSRTGDSRASWTMVRDDVEELRSELRMAAEHASLARASVGLVQRNAHREQTVAHLRMAARLAEDASGDLNDPMINDDGTRLLLLDVAAHAASYQNPMAYNTDDRLYRKLERWGDRPGSFMTK